ncbi:response regulator transcription factor [Pseudomonas lopnurensis]|uniref:response regulator transcription factor n=1 Tax=Pseudomonas lopnurensis TaxID=1477517 RepID=UPI0018799E72|nr:response regulator [Pseudomonas lopnurensis]MBE7374045.1 response regulator [Pseudomonas lopnurensis]
MSEWLNRTPHVLVIDDMPEDMKALLVLLRAQPWRLSVARDGYQGYQRALALRPDLILLDVCMPQMDGFTLCRLLREAPSTCRIPVIFLTSAGSLEERLEGLSLGGVDYVLKPFEPEEVLARIRIHLKLANHNGGQPAEEASALLLDDEQIMLRAALRYIEQHLGGLPNLSGIARKVGTYDKRLSALFRKHLGLTVFAYIREARLRRSQELLADSRLSVQDVADLVGFSSACNFSTAFRERLGITPTQFRHQMQEIQTTSAE